MPLASDNTAYNPIARANGTYAVEIMRAHDMPSIVEGFKSKAEAEEWIFQQMTERDDGLPPRMTIT
jgi:hypothetical protein